MNPVLREGNSDRRAAKAVKGIRSQISPYDGSLVELTPNHMWLTWTAGDFYGSEKSIVMPKTDSLTDRISKAVASNLLAENISLKKAK